MNPQNLEAPLRLLVADLTKGKPLAELVRAARWRRKRKKQDESETKP